jgi:hypothetical protein
MKIIKTFLLSLTIIPTILSYYSKHYKKCKIFNEDKTDYGSLKV